MSGYIFHISAFLFVILSVICVGFFLYCLRYALFMTNYSAQKQGRVFYIIVGVLVTWILGVLVLAYQGVFSDFSGLPAPPLLIFIPLPFVLWLTFWKPFGEFLKVFPSSGLIYIQAFRILVEMALWMLFTINLIPVQMTLEGYNFDIFTGVSAPLVAYLCFRKKMLPDYVSLAWNIAGLGLLINVLVIAILSLPTPLRVFMNEPALYLPAEFPFVLLPAVLVPFAYAYHFFSIRQYFLKKSFKMTS